jgi:hypothetical protein
MATRPAYVWTGSDWDDIGDKRVGALGASVTGKIDYATPTNLQTGTTYTFVSDDVNRITTASAGASALYTVPPQSSVTWAANAILRLVNYGAGAVTVEGGSGVTVQNTATTIGEFESAAVIRKGSDEWTLVPFGSKTGAIPAPSSVEYLVIAGGGGAGDGAGAGGAGGYRSSVNGETSGGGASAESPFSISPGTSYTVTVGGGGGAGANGSNSVFGSITSTGGGSCLGSSSNGTSGGSGGGGGRTGNVGGAGTANQGFAGGNASSTAGGGGGGAGAVGGAAGTGVGGSGGNGVASSITGSSVTLAGGGGAWGNTTAGAAGSGGGGAGTTGGGGSAQNGTANTGGGAGAGGSTSGSGGSGVVIIRHNRLNATATTTGSPTVSTQGEYTVYVFNASGTIEWAA